MWVQNMTTKEPDDDMIEVGIRQLRQSLTGRTGRRRICNVQERKAGGQDEMRMLRAMASEGEERLRQVGIEEAGLDAWYLLEFVTGVDKAHYYMNPDRRMEQKRGTGI